MTDGVPPAELRCSYPFKSCNNHRATKVDGSLHTLCKDHREKANQHQRDILLRRNMSAYRWEHSERGPAESAPTVQGSGAGHQLSFLDISDLLEDHTPLRVECKEDDLKAVEALLSD
jgi:hypothetical protein